MNEKLIENIKQLQLDYHSNPNIIKTFLNKKEIKKGCSEHVSRNINLDKLISETVYVIDDTNKIFIDYTVFKVYSSQSNYQTIVDFLVNKIKFIMSIHKTFEVHLNLKSLTISGIERYRPIFQIYYDTCCKNGLYYDSAVLDQIVIYNTPMIVNIITPIMVKYTDQSIKSKITYHK